MARTNTYKIDPVKLNMAIAERSLNKQSMSVAMGYSQDRISKVISDGRISIPMTKLLDLMFGIPLSEYSGVKIWEPNYKSRHEEVEALRVELIEVCRDTLIAEAREIVKEAMKEALESAVKGFTNG